MIRVLTPALCLMLAAAAAGRYHAEASVREARVELSSVRSALADEEERERRLRMEVEVLESASRLTSLNAQTVGLGAARPEQMTTREDFAAMIGREAKPDHRLDAQADTIGNAITMSDPDAVLLSGGRQ
ncbi:hypothetical protein [Parvularcula dongshanensis]|uniref:Cell division protein FtsL n=1 Tax=Parvularcula dongshanensis TaxID=1173995 RepID=A0A840I6E0_9PROT|nr:hypothetical protein [Parvularcula dongshanensis]MBB4659875.1 hypothetical protein [Parvularcula dongshanensis]